MTARSTARSIVSCVLLGVLGVLLAQPAFAAREPDASLLPEAMRSATYIGTAACAGCHRDIKDHFSHTAHARRLAQSPRNEFEARNCEACHGPGSEHQTDPGAHGKIVGFDRTAGVSVQQMNGMCLQCHAATERIHWAGSVHDVNGLACSDCHNPMAQFSARALQRRESISATCFGCHQQQRLQFQKVSHMPLPEGKITCTDCHNPHGSPTDPLLKADTVNHLCYTCHQEKRGPFLWEHAPVRENCLNCHNPHGSNHEFLLVTARPFLCQQCHSHLRHPNDLQTRAELVGGPFPDERLIGRSCQNCHSQIHGSNHPSGVRMHR